MSRLMFIFDVDETVIQAPPFAGSGVVISAKECEKSLFPAEGVVWSRINFFPMVSGHLSGIGL